MNFNDQKLIILGGTSLGILIGFGAYWMLKSKEPIITKKELNDLEEKEKKIPKQLMAWRASSPGKMILFGDHSKQLMIGAAIDLRTVVTCYQYPELDADNESKVPFLQFSFGMSSDDRGSNLTWSRSEVNRMFVLAKQAGLTHKRAKRKARTEFLEQLLQSSLVRESKLKSAPITRTFLFLFFCLISDVSHPMAFRIITELPSGYLMGSSAAMASSLVAVLLLRERVYACDPSLLPTNSTRCNLCREYYFCPSHRNFINSWVYQSEELIHGMSLGVDNAMTVYGGGLYFTYDAESGRTLSKSLFPYGKILNPPLRTIFVPTNERISARAFNSYARQYSRENPEKVSSLFQKLYEISRKAKDVFKNLSRNHWWPLLNKQIFDTQMVLQKLRIGGTRLSKIVDIALKHGFSAKSSGYGNGAIIVLMDTPLKEAEEALFKDLTDSGFTPLFLDAFVEGVRREVVEVSSSPLDKIEPQIQGTHYSLIHQDPEKNVITITKPIFTKKSNKGEGEEEEGEEEEGEEGEAEEEGEEMSKNEKDEKYDFLE